MNRQAQKLLPYAVVILALAAIVWAISMGRLPPAEFAFDNRDEVETVDPALSTGVPEGRVLDLLFEGLLRELPVGVVGEDGRIVVDDQGRLVGQPQIDEMGNAAMKNLPAVAESYTLSPDGMTYTFNIRPSAAWSSGEPMTSADFIWSWRRMLHPETASQYAYQLYYVDGAQKYNEAVVEVGDHVEIEMPDRPRSEQLFPRGTIHRGVLLAILKPPQPKLPSNAPAKEREKAGARWKSTWGYVVKVVEPGAGGNVDFDAEGKVRVFSTTASDALGDRKVEKCLHVLVDFETEVALSAPDDRTLIVNLENPTPYFTDLVAFYPLYPVNRRCIEKFGTPHWTKPENMVCNGPYRLEFRRIRDRVRVKKNPRYWNAEQVQIESIDAMPTKSSTTALNMYVNGQIDWATIVPNAIVPELKQRDDFVSQPMLACYFYRLNVHRKPLDNVLVRRALNMAIDKRLICEKVTRAGQLPAQALVPPLLHEYESPTYTDLRLYDVQNARRLLHAGAETENGKADARQILSRAGYRGSDEFVAELITRAEKTESPAEAYPAVDWMEHNVEKAREMLALAGYPGGHGFPKIQILYNTDESHRSIAEVLQQQWKNSLGIDVELRNVEWGTFLSTLHKTDYTVARSGWIGDYPDPVTFIDMFVTDGGNNQTNWSNARYDKLVETASGESDLQRRLELLSEAEGILLAEMPIIPIYYYVSLNMVSPRIKGFHSTARDRHPLHILRIER